MVLTRAQEQRLSRLEVVVVDIQKTLDQKFSEFMAVLNRSRDDELCDDRSPLDRYSPSSQKVKGSGSEGWERSLNEEELVETEVATEPIETKHGIVKPETNANMILANLEEEPISQLQVHVSRLEPSLRFHNASPDVCEDFKSLVGFDGLFDHVKARAELVTKSTSVTNNQAAHQLFDKMSLGVQSSKRRQIKCHKSWRFKFKHRVVPRDSKSGFEVKMKQNLSKEYPRWFLASNLTTLVHTLFGGEMKFSGCKMLIQLLLSIHKKRQRKTPKYHKTWKFRFKNMDLQRVMTQLDTRHFIFRWNKQQLGCRVVMLHFKNKGRFRCFQSFSEMKQRVIVNVRKSFGYLMEVHSSKYKGLGCVVEKKKLRNVEDGVKQDKNRLSGDVGAKIFITSEELHLPQDVFEMVKELLLKTSLLSPQVMRNTKLKFPKRWMFKFRKKKIDQQLGCDLMVTYLENQTTWASRFDEEDQRNLQSRTENSLSRREVSTFISQAKALLFESKDWREKQIPTLKFLKQINISQYRWIQEVIAVIGFLLRRHLHLNLDCEEPKLAGQKRNHGLLIRLHSKQKQRKCPKSWMFKFKTGSKLAGTSHLKRHEESGLCAQIRGVRKKSKLLLLSLCLSFLCRAMLRFFLLYKTLRSRFLQRREM